MTVPGLPAQKVGREPSGESGMMEEGGKAAGRQPQAAKRLPSFSSSGTIIIMMHGK